MVDVAAFRIHSRRGLRNAPPRYCVKFSAVQWDCNFMGWITDIIGFGRISGPKATPGISPRPVAPARGRNVEKQQIHPGSQLSATRGRGEIWPVSVPTFWPASYGRGGCRNPQTLLMTRRLLIPRYLPRVGPRGVQSVAHHTSVTLCHISVYRRMCGVG